jgi:hypothetical protein
MAIEPKAQLSPLHRRVRKKGAYHKRLPDFRARQLPSSVGSVMAREIAQDADQRTVLHNEYRENIESFESLSLCAC